MQAATEVLDGKPPRAARVNEQWLVHGTAGRPAARGLNASASSRGAEGNRACLLYTSPSPRD
eukprot:1471831-Alexandrium_andersonii.AAC.1